MRAMVSVPPPAGNGTMMRACFLTGSARARVDAATPAASTNIPRRVNMGSASPVMIVGAPLVGAQGQPRGLPLRGWGSARSCAHTVVLQRAADLIEDRRVVDRRRHGPRLGIGDLLHRAAQDLARACLGQARHRD